ncbi:MAG TPA: haloacid dehalogenase type II [Candidatus Angelobacter sp.]|nr:haloacid dehalogenase type II [Candidatus Angelobacter sp.]
MVLQYTQLWKALLRLDRARHGGYSVFVPFESIRLITFDCYGTLIDWESGMLQFLRPLFSKARAVSDFDLLEQYAEAEVELEAGPYLPYKQVLSRTVQEMGNRLRVSVSAEEGARFAESLKTWEPFPDTVDVLRQLAQHFELGIISNVDDDLFAATEKKLKARFSVIVTAQQVRSYKPSLRNFQEVLRRSGKSKEQMLHAGQSIYHDIVPASSLGIANVWVNRPSIRPGAGAAKAALAEPTHQVQSLAGLVELLIPADTRGQAAI